MKEVVKVSISGIAFTFDEDAYKVVNDYLKKLEAGYAKHPDGREIIADIEARVAELILEHQQSDKIIDKPLAEKIVERMGYPDDMDSGEENPIEEFPRRLYRNPEGAKLAGICSGVGAYFRIDPVWIRLAIFAPLLMGLVGSMLRWGAFHNFWYSLFGFVVVLYFVLWIAVPMAKTPRQKLEMRGERITADSIRQGFEDEASAMNDSVKSKKNASVWADIMYVLGRILQVFLKIIVFFIAFVVGIVTLSLLIALLAVIFGANVAIAGLSIVAVPDLVGISSAGYGILLAFILLIPLVVFLYWLIKVIFSSKTNRSFLTTIWVIWTVLLVWFIVLTVRNADNIRYGIEDAVEEYGGGRYSERWEDDGDYKEMRFGPNVRYITREDGGPLMLKKKNGRTEIIVLPETGGSESEEWKYEPEENDEW